MPPDSNGLGVSDLLSRQKSQVRPLSSRKSDRGRPRITRTHNGGCVQNLSDHSNRFLHDQVARTGLG